ncbi:hypothetical protein CHS0354_035879 [Potamilus streckersoni]|uniref:RING-type domain-containing protein n=1 Tax=Potamilus streckersoni TaxID=2493646 RepID=A0AAE0SQY7_9BIVA|nr:hypothetical protein CHS0354_035879 [Potamilus streckersoni]
MSEYLCRVLIDLTTAPKNVRNDIILDRFIHFDNGIIVLEEKNAKVKIFPGETKYFSNILSKAATCYSSFNKNVLHAVNNKTILVFNKGERSVLDENIFTNFERSIEMDFKSCVKLEYDAIQGLLCVPLQPELIINERKKVPGVLYPRPLTVPLKQYSEESYMTGENEYTNGTCSLQYCIANVVQPNSIVISSVHSDGGGSSQFHIRQSISSSRQNSFGNPQSEYSLQYSQEIDSANSHYSVENNVSFNSEHDTEYAQQPRHPGFAEYNSRKASFATWQQFVLFSTDVLARAGFYCIGEGTIVRCFFCGTELVNLSPNDDPLLEHIRKLPSCGYLRRNLGPRRIAEYQARIRNGHIDSPQTHEVPSRVTSRNPGPWSSSDHIRSPQYQAYSVRLASFARWPSDIRQRPEQVADAGFYYTGLQDVVRCFACDGGLKNWDPEDDPWIEHARWFPQCPFVLRVKGHEFIVLVRRMMEDSDEDEDAVVHSTFQPNNPMAVASSLRNELNTQLDEENAENVLETDAAKYALDAGYSRTIVARSINELLIKGKLNYTSEDIMELILEKEDKGEVAIEASGFINPSPTPGPSTQKNDAKRSLIAENERLRQCMQCVECKVAKRDILLLPCTHLCLCSNCSDKASICPLCYKKIREKIKTYVI